PVQAARGPGGGLGVLGMLAAEGGRWDGVWVLGLTDQVFPAVPNQILLFHLVRWRDIKPLVLPQNENLNGQKLVLINYSAVRPRFGLVPLNLQVKRRYALVL